MDDRVGSDTASNPTGRNSTTEGMQEPEWPEEYGIKTAREAMKKLVGCLICLSTTKLTSTRRLPKVVTTMQMARLTAMKMVSREPKGAGQHSGPQGVP